MHRDVIVSRDEISCRLAETVGASGSEELFGDPA